MIDDLANVDGVSEQWRRQAQTRDEANKPFYKTPADIEELTRIFDDVTIVYDPFPYRDRYPRRGR